MPDGRKLRGVSGRQAIRAFGKDGWEVKGIRGDHARLEKEGYPVFLIIPLHADIGVGLLVSQVKRAGLSVRKFQRLLRDP